MLVRSVQTLRLKKMTDAHGPCAARRVKFNLLGRALTELGLAESLPPSTVPDWLTYSGRIMEAIRGPLNVIRSFQHQTRSTLNPRYGVP